MKIIAFDEHFTKEKEQEELWLTLPGSIREGFSEERAFELGLEGTLNFTSILGRGNTRDNGLQGMKNTLKFGEWL